MVHVRSVMTPSTAELLKSLQHILIHTGSLTGMLALLSFSDHHVMYALYAFCIVLSNNQPRSTTEIHSIILNAIYD